jgi:flagellar protein FliS
MSPEQGYNAYRFARATTSKTRQVVMLYEAALAAMLQAKEAMERGDIEGRLKHSDKAMQIISGLQQSLDFDHGREVASLLYDFYSGLLNSIYKLQRYNRIDACERVIAKLKDMLQSWNNIDQQHKVEDAPAVSANGGTSAMPTDVLTISA